MPSKGKRVAARQGNLRRRRSNNNRVNQAAPTAPTAVAEAAMAPATSSTPAATVTAASPAAPTGATQATGRPAAQPRSRRFDRPAAYNHVGTELTRIGIFSGALLVVLIAVSFVI